ncbi:MAG: fructose-bisphosphate aldolase class I [Candidatus Magasanikbacteria bacterium CG10_big_fil_rev_8_21_14_0_10_40_10]|uniref:Probable fructose-bisphosphate aldolase class 1 n=1 Tax=Candidatus Magasanikbacteria bacterium CG10_big_fil_rev_8_21_14_0_10_40_10 TaxID=1974648 RepID=A0A2M6W4I5_9BACT|nr:MAG: fructose-bisphosphate aldolase class I [Candidatus Magasanikbacteria bacterium CG10_big_fil_rev_8_21_14_0_10_40_10]
MAEETLSQIANKMVALGKGILAADESAPTIKKRLNSVGVESTEENRRTYRGLLFTAHGLEQYISGVIMFDETLRQNAANGINFSNLLAQKGILSGIKVDQGTELFAGSEVEKFTKGLDGLSERLQEYYSLGARFAKWRATYSIGNSLPSEKCLLQNAQDLAEYAYLCQQNSIVPIVEPEVLMDGAHSIEDCYQATKKVLKAVFEQLAIKNVALDSIVLKPNMVISGQNSGILDTPEKVAQMTVDCFKETVPPQVPGIVFLSGGQSEQQACSNLNAMNVNGQEQMWQLSFSFGRALQNSALQTWAGKEENIIKAQEVFLRRAKLSSLARSGQYKEEMENN